MRANDILRQAQDFANPEAPVDDTFGGRICGCSSTAQDSYFPFFVVIRTGRKGLEFPVTLVERDTIGRDISERHPPKSETQIRWSPSLASDACDAIGKASNPS